MTRVLIVRHGEAVGADEADSDAQRWLTPQGRRTVRAVAGALHEAGVRFDQVFTSPLVRAAQTAEILVAHTSFEGPLHVWPALGSGSTARALAALEEVAHGATVVLVGHEPQVRAMVSQLAGVPGTFPFRTGAACLVELSAAGGAFRWMLDPRTLSRVERLEELAR